MWGLRPTWRLVQGPCRQSLALEVARSCQVPEQVLLRAAQLYAGTSPAAYASAAAAGATAGGQAGAEPGERGAAGH